RDAVARDLARRDPRRAGELRRRAAAEVWGAGAGSPRLWQTTADLLYLVENPAVRHAFFPPGAGEHAVEPAGPADWDAIGRISRAWDSPEAAEAIRRWWGRHPGAFSVTRGADGRVTGFSATVERRELDPDVVAGDPVAEVCATDLRDRPTGDDELVLLARRFLAEEGGGAMGPAMAALFLDVKRLYMEMRPRLRRVYTAVVHRPGPDPFLDALGFARVGGPVAMGDVDYQAVVLDFGPGSVDGWLRSLIDAEARAEEPAHAPLTVS
ncbi:MAG TPA: hypothetical protein VK904_04740, partial [Miltoncostaeaceae bacterium]|nr:hypothetical protein [Miltoncostaeaceae bacterium]